MGDIFSFVNSPVLASIACLKLALLILQQLIDIALFKLRNTTCLFILGSEYGIVLLSTVRSRPMSQDIGDTADISWIRKNLGFVTDRHRICVGITRSKYGLVIVGEQINGCRVYIL